MGHTASSSQKPTGVGRGLAGVDEGGGRAPAAGEGEEVSYVLLVGLQNSYGYGK